MAILTNAKIKEACEFVVAASEKYQRLQWIAYNTMLRTGCREGEIEVEAYKRRYLRDEDREERRRSNL